MSFDKHCLMLLTSRQFLGSLPDLGSFPEHTVLFYYCFYYCRCNYFFYYNYGYSYYNYYYYFDCYYSCWNIFIILPILIIRILPYFIYYLLTYLAITTCYRSWPQLICGAIRHELLQLGANFGYPAFLDSHQPVWPNAGEAVLVCDNHHLAQIRRLYELSRSCQNAIF